MLSQLKRQASAHTEHLAEKLAGQAKNLDQQHRTELEVKLHEQQRVYYRELEKKVKSISAIQGKVRKCFYFLLLLPFQNRRFFCFFAGT